MNQAPSVALVKLPFSKLLSMKQGWGVGVTVGVQATDPQGLAPQTRLGKLPVAKRSHIIVRVSWK